MATALAPAPAPHTTAPRTITVPVADLRDALARVSRVMLSRTTLPVLACVRLTADRPDDGEDTLTLEATNLDAYVRTRVPLDDAASLSLTAPFRVAIPAASLTATLQHATAATATLTAPRAAAGIVELRVGRARYRLAGLDPAEFPEFRGADAPDVTGTPRVPAGVLQRAIKRVQHAASTDAVAGRVVMNSVHFEPAEDAPDTLDVIAMDNPRFARLRLAVPAGFLGACDGGAIVPTGAVTALGSVFDADELVTLAAHDALVRVVSERTTFVARCLEGPYPPWRRFVRETSAVTVIAERAAVLAALERVAFAAADAGKLVGLTFSDADGGACQVWATSDAGSATDTVACQVPNATAVTLGVNAAYLRDLLAKTFTGPTVVLGLDTPRTPIQLADPDDPTAAAILAPLNAPPTPVEA